MKIRIVILFILIAAASRLFPHPPNFTPIAAMGLLGAAYLQRSWLAYLVPMAALFLSDLVLNNTIYAHLYNGFTWFTSVWIYLAFALVIAVGRLILSGKVAPGRIVAAAVLASTIFFLISNFYSWQFFPGYPKTFSGLMAAYTAGLPFYGFTLLGDLCFTGLFFSAYALAQRRLALARN